MSNTDPPLKPASRMTHVFSAIFLIAGLVLFEAFSETWFEKGPGINWARVVCAGLVGAVAGAIGFLVGWSVDRVRR